MLREREWQGQGLGKRFLLAVAPLMGLAYIVVLPLAGVLFVLRLAASKIAGWRHS